MKANNSWNKVAYEFKNTTLKLLWPHCSVEGFRVVEMWHTIRAVTRALLRISLMTSMFRLNLIKYAGDKQYYLKVRQIRNDFFKPTFLPKNERTNSTLLLVDLFSFVFWKKVKTPKRHFEINWPLHLIGPFHGRT